MAQNQLAKTCITCGLQKPLQAFLQISGPEGTSYGSICGTCRGSGMGKKIVIPEKEDDHNSSSSTGLKLDAKAKVELEAAKRETAQEQKDADKKEREKLESNEGDLLENKQEREAGEKRHREEFIEPKKREGFLNYQADKTPTEFAKTIAGEQQARIEKSQQDETSRDEDRAQGLGFEDLQTDITQLGLIKNQSSEMIKARAILGASAPINISDQQREAAQKANTQAPQATKVENKTEAKETLANNPVVNEPARQQTPAAAPTTTQQFQRIASWLDSGTTTLNASFLAKNFSTNNPTPTAPKTPETKTDPILSFVNTTFQVMQPLKPPPELKPPQTPPPVSPGTRRR